MDSIYGSTKVLDGRHFAEEFIRRRKLAEKGIVESASANGGSGGFAMGSAGSESSKAGGWSEVAKKNLVEKFGHPFEHLRVAAMEAGVA